MMISEANSRCSPDRRTSRLPCLPACSLTSSRCPVPGSLLRTHHLCRNGVEALYPKCMDYTVPEPVEHYKAILKGLARLSGAHRNGRLSPEFDRKFPYNRKQASAVFALRAPEEKLIQRANRMFDFIGRYPKLFPENVRSPGFREQFIRDIPIWLPQKTG